MRGFSKRPRDEHLNTENLCELEGLHCKVTEKLDGGQLSFNYKKKKKKKKEKKRKIFVGMWYLFW